MATESGFVQAAIPKLDGHYDYWSMLMENFMRSNEYWTVIENGVHAAAEGEKAFEEAKLKDMKAKNYLFQAIDRSILETILNKETTKGGGRTSTKGYLWRIFKRKGTRSRRNARMRKSCMQA
ncbi:hypothetical protein Salat_1722000 [Sesamum alatum]|uniref:Retrovirus-related Pol polyprotein from transposon TNT 1-94 n=1 Tax=Sesamum alatum TaxID=300844 RepID=A0AAE1Y8R5_9LAMI|nr:hypothetical protein Salat_1722000 [Sesamum alatum]